MNRVILVVVSLAAFVCLAIQYTIHSAETEAQKSAPLSSQDEAAVREVVALFAKTWNKHDMKAMHELNTDDVEWINVTANHWRGNAAVSKGHSTIHRTVFAKTDMSVDKVLVRSIAPGVALAVATMKFGPVIMPTGDVLAELPTRGTFTMVKRGANWKIVHFQNTNIDADAEKDDPITWDETGFLPRKKLWWSDCRRTNASTISRGHWFSKWKLYLPRQ